jgi:hypothetical protein
MNWIELESFMTDGIAAQGRNISIMTSIATGDYLVHTMTVENAVGFVEWMEEKKKLDLEESKNLIEMLRSPDIENFNIALLAIEHIRNEHSI